MDWSGPEDRKWHLCFFIQPAVCFGAYALESVDYRALGSHREKKKELHWGYVLLLSAQNSIAYERNIAYMYCLILINLCAQDKFIYRKQAQQNIHSSRHPLVDSYGCRRFIKIYFSLGMSYQDILSALALHGIIVSKRQLTRILRACGLYCRQYSELDDAIDFKAGQLEGPGKLHGYRWMYAKCSERGICIRKEDMRILTSLLCSTQSTLKHAWD